MLAPSRAVRSSSERSNPPGILCDNTSVVEVGRSGGLTQLAALGYTVPKKRGRPRVSANGVGNGATVRKGRKGKVKAKYRDSKTGDTWSGRGRMASWLKSKQDGGENIEIYLVCA